MLSLFQPKWPQPPSGAAPTPTSSADPAKGLLRPEAAAALMATPRRQRLLEHIWQRTSLSRRQFAALYLAPLERYAELVQQFPASEAHHHAYPGGMLDHGLEIVAYALKLRQSHLLPIGAAPETQAAQAEAWTAGTAYAALLHDIGKLAVDLHVEHADGAVWHPWHGPLLKPYRFRHRKQREYRLHSAATGLIYARLLDPAILDWLSGYAEVWAALLFVLAGQYEHAGTLGELVVQADQASVAQDLGGDPSKAFAAPKTALQRKLLDGLRFLLRGELKLNQPQASDGWLTQDALWLVSKTTSDKLRAHLLQQGIDGIPSSNTAIFNVLQEHGIALPTPDDKAIWRATITSDAGWSHSFTFLRLSPALIWEAGERPAPFTGQVEVDQTQESAAPHTADASDPAGTAGATPPPSPTNTQRAAHGQDHDVNELPGSLDMTPPTRVSGPVSSQSASPPAADVRDDAPDGAPDPFPVTSADPRLGIDIEPSGEHFMRWLAHGVQTRKLIINDTKALVHTVTGTAYLVSPGLFQRYAQEHLQVASYARKEELEAWRWVQKRFEKLAVHRKQPSGLNIWTCEVTGPRKSRRLHGYLLVDPTALFAPPPPDNPYLGLADEGPATARAIESRTSQAEDR
jgi:integrating conjugative element relaxase (TIGR03760 family)